ncbi:cytochrome c maturation protein CcmE [Legionella sp. CNM-4043-24]|uniref:cytochrome c maturation protein CcmE n=1 Tax=Legionella sp. CNM-4043-24 TaxID=3421646 RepID=UPI00403B0405
MNPVRKRKLLLLVFIASVLTLATSLVLYALRQNISLFYTPTQIAAGEVSGKRQIRLGGMVVKGSVKRSGKDLTVEFALGDFNKTVIVRYHGILPDLFREGQGIVAMGEVVDNQHFNATEVLAKHDASYMPPEVRDALKKGKESSNGGKA